MSVLPSAVAALDAQSGVATVAQNGLYFLDNLAAADANKVAFVV